MRGSVTTMVQRRAPRSCGSLISVAALLTASSILTAACHGVVAGPHAATAPPGPARVTINPAAGAIDRRPDLGITVNATDGTLTSVTAEDGHGKNVAGYFNPAGTAWHSTWALAPARSYAVTAVAAGLDGGASTAHATFRTSAPAQTFTASVDMLPGETVGVGMPIMVTFSQPIQNKAQVERSFQLRSSKPVVGAWRRGRWASRGTPTSATAASTWRLRTRPGITTTRSAGIRSRSSAARCVAPGATAGPSGFYPGARW